MEDNKQALDVIDLARQKYGPIYLGGSRRMHQLSGDEDNLKLIKEGGSLSAFLEQNYAPTIPITEDTDYDFYATHSEELLQFLIANQFEETSASKAVPDDGYGRDDEAITVLERDNVQIVLRRDAEFYRAVFDNIDPIFYKQYLWKSSGLSTVVREDIQPIINMLFGIGHAAQQITTKEETCLTSTKTSVHISTPTSIVF